MILDTSFIIDLLKGNRLAVDKVIELENSSKPILATAISVFEIWQGTADIKNEGKKQRILDMMGSFGLLVLDFESAKEGGEIHSRLEKKGMQIEPEDSMIAGICIKNNKKIMTRNVKHFNRIKDLEIETY